MWIMPLDTSRSIQGADSIRVPGPAANNCAFREFGEDL